MIGEYKGEYYFLSNRYYSFINIDGYTFKNATSAHLSFKDKRRQEEFTNLLPQEAIELASTIMPTKEWEEKELHFLYRVLVNKFKQNKFLEERLLKIDKDKLPKTEHGNIIKLVHEHLSSQRRIREHSEEEINTFLENVFSKLIKG